MKKNKDLKGWLKRYFMLDWERSCTEEIIIVIKCVQKCEAIGGTVPLFTADYDEAESRVKQLKKYLPLDTIVPRMHFENIMIDEDDIFEDKLHYRVKLIMVNSIVM